VTRYVIAVDGGNSKTDVVLANDVGDILARTRVAGTRREGDDSLIVVDTLASGVRQARAQAGLPPDEPIAAAVFCLANVDTDAEEAQARRELEAFRVADEVRVHNDTVAVLRAGASAGWGVAVVCGAGINAIGVHPDGRVHRFLALGPESGDWGGGAGVGMAGLGSAVRAGDGRGAPTTLRELIPAALGRPDPETAAFDVSRGAVTELDLLDLAPVVLAAATAGDAVSVAIVVRLADEVAEFANAALRGLGLLDREPEVVLGGGVLQAGNAILLDRIGERVQEVASAARIVVLDVPPVVGPLIDALQLAQASPEAVRSARAAVAAAIGS
jgi:N-acetylglucosamine kinase-like BadF-type ATPase